jgi:hypothetical protein
LFDLILHQGDQRGDHDRETGTSQCGQLKAQGLAAAGGEQCEDIPTGQSISDDLFLVRPKPGVSEHLLEQ